MFQVNPLPSSCNWHFKALCIKTIINGGPVLHLGYELLIFIMVKYGCNSCYLVVLNIS